MPIVRSHFVLLAVLQTMLAASGTAQVWSLLTPSAQPQAREGHMTATDTLRGRVVLFGGRQGASQLIFWPPETSEWTGTTWTSATPGISPLGRWYGAMAFDSRRGRAVLFGGYREDPNVVTQFGDTWEWNGTSWINAAPSFGPSPRHGHAMAFDSARGSVVLFGGNDFHTGQYYQDTWLWNGTFWLPGISVQLPAARMCHSMASDTARGVVVLFGGSPAGNTWLNDTWEWGATGWTRVQTASAPSVRQEAGMVFRPTTATTLLFGGRNGTHGTLAETWEYDGTNWVRRIVPLEPPALHSNLAWDSVRARALLSCAGPNRTDTWAFGHVQATAIPFGQGCGVPALTLAAAPGSLPVIGSVQLTNVTNVPSSIAFMSIGLSGTAVGPFPLPMPLAGFGAPNCSLYHDTAFGLAFSCAANGPGAAQHSLPIPNQLHLVNLPLRLQAWAPAPGANAASLIVSNGVLVSLGTQ